VDPGGDQLGESPVWDGRRGVLYRVDRVGRAVLSLDLTTRTERRFDGGRHVGSVVMGQDDGLLVAARGGFYALDTSTVVSTGSRRSPTMSRTC
jgi:sugar lactone lactonase YvrE